MSIRLFKTLRKKYLSYGLVVLLGAIILFCLTGAQRWQRPPEPEKQLPINYVSLSPGSKTGAKLPVAGAKNEYLNLYFRIKGADPASVKLSVRKKSAPGVSYTFYQVRPIPFMATSRFHIPADALVPLAEGVKGMEPLDFLVTIKIPGTAASGVHAHELVFADRKGSFSIPLELTVWNFSLPNDLPITIMGNLWGVPKWFAPYGVKTEAQFGQAVKSCLSLMREYKINGLGPKFYPFNAKQVAPGKKVEEQFPGYHKMLSYALNDLQYRYVCLPRLQLGKKEIQTRNDLLQPAKNFFPLFQGYLRSHGWEGRSINKLMDEPILPYYPSVYESYKLTKDLAPSLKTFCTGRAPDPRLARVINIWAISGRFYNQITVDAARAQGQEIWLYFNRLHMMFSPNASQRLLGWLLFRYKFSGYFFWGMNAWWVDVYGNEPLPNKLGGILLYPNPRNGHAWPTTRLEAIRRGLQDYQYLDLLEKARSRGRVDPQAYAELQRRVKQLTDNFRPGMEFRITFREMEDLRNSMGEILNRAGL